LLERWQIPGTAMVIHRVTEGPRTGDYLFSPSTVRKAIKNYELVKNLPYKTGASRHFYAWYLTHPGDAIAPLVNALPDVFRTKMIGNQALWQWIALAIAIIASFATIILAYYFGRKMAAKRLGTDMIRYGLTLAYPVLAMLVPMVFNHVLEEEIRIAGKTLSTLTFSANIVFLLGAMVVINGLGTRIAEFIISNPKIPSKGLDAQFIRLIARVLSLVLAVIVFLEGGKYLGIPLSTLLASAGVGGLAFALAAQDSLKNFFGSIMIYLDKPYRIGERILVKGYDGVVEEIGLRSTRLRLLNGHQATIPNEEMARSDIENVSRRPHIRRLADLRLPIDTPPDMAEKGVEIIRKILEDHEGLDPDFPPRAYFTEIHPDYLNLRFLYWYHPPEYWDFLEFSQGVNLRIQREFAEAGIALESPMKLLDVTNSAEDTAASLKPAPAEDTPGLASD
jgi:MscS family membrane protein